MRENVPFYHKTLIIVTIMLLIIFAVVFRRVMLSRSCRCDNNVVLFSSKLGICIYNKAAMPRAETVIWNNAKSNVRVKSNTTYRTSSLCNVQLFINTSNYDLKFLVISLIFVFLREFHRWCCTHCIADYHYYFISIKI